MTVVATTSPRAAAIVRLLHAGLAALDDFRAKSPGEAADIYAHVAAHMRSAAPMAFAALPAALAALVAPEPPVAGDVTGALNDGASYKLGIVADALWLKLRDHDDDKALVTMTAGQAGAFGRDFWRVLAKLGGGRG